MDGQWVELGFDHEEGIAEIREGLCDYSSTRRGYRVSLIFYLCSVRRTERTGRFEDGLRNF